MTVSSWGIPPWQVDLAIPAVPIPAKSEVVVVGGGLTGVSAAYHLARRGFQVALLEASTIGAGASGRTGAIVLEDSAAGPLTGASDCLPMLSQLTAEAGIECDLRLPGCWELVHRTEPQTARSLWQDGKTRLCISGTEPGGTVDAGALLGGLARAAIVAGATIHEQSEVSHIDVGRPIRLQLPTEVLHADALVLALNAYTPTLLPLAHDLRVALTVAVCTEVLNDASLAAIGLRDRMPFYTADLPYLWGRPLSDGRLIFGAGLTFPPSQDVTDITLKHSEAAAALGRLEARIRGFHSALCNVSIQARWGGPIAFRKHRTPILSRYPGAEEIILTGAYAGHGVALSIRIGELAAAAISSGQPLPTWGSLAPVPGCVH